MKRTVLRIVGKRDLVRIVTAIAIAAPIVLAASLAYASRPGGGSSYSGGSKSSGSKSSGGGGSYSGGGGGGGDGGEALGAILVLCFEHPVIGIPLLIIFIVVAFVYKRAQNATSGSDWSSGGGAYTSFGSPGYGMPNGNVFQPMAPPAPRPALRAKLEELRRTDPGFSIVVFEDFLYFLYAEVHRARASGGAQALAAYVADAAQAPLANTNGVTEVVGIIIGSMTYERVNVDPQGAASVDVTIESNYVERYAGGREQRYFAKEVLTLSRAAGAKSRDPGKARTLNCPNCGGPLSNMRGTTCSYCKTTVPQGSKDWAITGFRVVEREMRGPLLTSSVEEVGTNLPSIRQPSVATVFQQIQAKDPQGTQWPQIEHRMRLVFEEFHAGWVQRDPSKVRPYVSDNLFQSQMYWIDLYKQSRCINRTDGSAIARMELCAATTDAYYDSITIRMWASGLDFTISEDGRLLSGSQSVRRSYSEYWTLIRGAQKKKTDKDERSCPNCGAPMKISMTGNCEYCKVKVTGGEYDWVLSRIEQDEAYTG